MPPSAAVAPPRLTRMRRTETADAVSAAVVFVNISRSLASVTVVEDGPRAPATVLVFLESDLSTEDVETACVCETTEGRDHEHTMF